MRKVARARDVAVKVETKMAKREKRKRAAEVVTEMDQTMGVMIVKTAKRAVIEMMRAVMMTATSARNAVVTMMVMIVVNARSLAEEMMTTRKNVPVAEKRGSEQDKKKIRRNPYKQNHRRRTGLIEKKSRDKVSVIKMIGVLTRERGQLRCV